MTLPLTRLFCLLLVISPVCRASLPAENTTPPAFALPEHWPDHPRLLATQADWVQLKERRASDPELETYVRRLLAQADKVVKLRPLERIMTGRRLLHVSRDLIRRTLLCSFAWRVTGDHRYLDHARRELLSVAAFPDWNPSHFLDVAEASAGMAIGYDWLYADLSDADREIIRKAMVEKGLALVRNGHSTFRNTNNWAQVCAGGLSLAALALGDEDPALAADVLAQTKAGVPFGMRPYAPDGIYPEGPAYWSYGTNYEILLLASLRSALHQDWGIPGQPGFSSTATFYAQAISPGGDYFNYADCGKRGEPAAALFYLAREQGHPELVLSQKQLLCDDNSTGSIDRFGVLICFWWPHKNTAPAQQSALHFHGQGENPVAIWRSSWTDPKASYFAIKAGGAGVSHGHMDGGSFVYETRGVRWAVDPGMQDYESLESKGIKLWDRGQNSDRWRIFRLGSAAHNTLTINDHLHKASGLAHLLQADEQGAVIDLSPVFLQGDLGSAKRSITYAPEKVVITDRLQGVPKDAIVRWTMNTHAAITLQGSQALLSQKHQQLLIRFAGQAVTLKVIDRSAGPAAYDAPNPGLKQLVAEGPAGENGAWELSTTLGEP